jgi:hypothetical protein
MLIVGVIIFIILFFRPGGAGRPRTEGIVLNFGAVQKQVLEVISHQ